MGYNLDNYMKKLAKQFIVSILSWQVNRLRKKSDFKIVGVVGSIGKTSTKMAVAKVLSEGLSVRYQEGNYNDLVTVPLIFFGLSEPSLMNPMAWISAFMKIEKQIHRPYPYDVVVVELGTDGPDQISQFARYIHCDLAVLTAISLEHMEFFSGLDAVAEEELSIAKFSDLVIINSDLCDAKYLSSGLKLNTYGLNGQVDYDITDLELGSSDSHFTLSSKSGVSMKLDMNAVAKGEVYSAVAAAAVAEKLGLDTSAIQTGVGKLKPVSGRMQRLNGINNSLIIDESYNSSPEAVREALDTLYRLSAPQKIAVLGNMNELGSFSEKAHKDIGSYCDPKQLDLVMTIGKDANRYLADSAKAAGCQVLTFDSPRILGEKLKEMLENSAIVLFKGSQNGVFLEEAIKVVLVDPKDASKLVRQSPAWLKKKQSI
jgi:UDP-N-acetylmuramoyl-tripeptide--D-alanyl-D-alanine ligase